MLGFATDREQRFRRALESVAIQDRGREDGPLNGVLRDRSECLGHGRPRIRAERLRFFEHGLLRVRRRCLPGDPRRLLLQHDRQPERAFRFVYFLMKVSRSKYNISKIISNTQSLL